MHACSADPFQILKKLNDNVYVTDFGISPTLNVKNLMDYKGLDFILLVDEHSLEPIFEKYFLHSKIFYQIKQIKSIKSWMMRLLPAPPMIMGLEDIRSVGKEKHCL